MGWKDDLVEIKEQNERMIHLIRMNQGQLEINNKRIETMQVLLNGLIKNQSRSADRMADRMIEMAMVRQGSPEMAATHRRTLSECLVPDETDLWQDNPSTQWPPPGCDAVDMP